MTLRVLEFITPAGFYGAERWVLALANNINVEAVECDLAVSDEGQDLALLDYYPESAGQIHKIPMKGRFDLSVIRGLCDIIRDRKIDVIHTHGYKSDILGLVVAKRTGIACVSTPHGFSGKVSLKLATFILMGTFTLRYFDAVVPLSEELQSDMRRFKVPESKTRFIRNGVDLKEIDQALIEIEEQLTANKNPSEFTIGFIGQMIPRKGIPELLAVFDDLYRRYPQLRLQLVGDGAQRRELEQQAQDLDSRGAIEFLGFRSDRLALLKDFDLFIMTSSLEGIPRCMMEAMAVGIPVVAYDIPGIDQLVTHEKTGLLAPWGNREALKQCCEAVINNPEAAKARAEGARLLVENQYSAARMAKEYQSLFEDLLTHGQLTPMVDGEKS